MSKTRHRIKGPFSLVALNSKEKAFDREELVADNMGLTTLVAEDLKQFPNLQALYIPNNKIEKLDNLQNNFRITFLDARNNKIRDLDMEKQEYMRELYLAGNQLHDLEKILSKMDHMKDLKVLDLRQNPLTLEKGYRSLVISKFPDLITLDGLDVTPFERKKKSTNTPSLTSVQTSVVSRKSGTRPNSVLQVLLARPLSAADATVQYKANRIRMAKIMKEKREMEEQTAIARKRKEEYEEAANKRIAPMADGSRVLERSELMQRCVPAATPQPKKRPTTRMYVKMPIYTKSGYLTADEERAAKLNPELPPIFDVRLSHKTVYPE